MKLSKKPKQNVQPVMEPMPIKIAEPEVTVEAPKPLTAEERLTRVEAALGDVGTYLSKLDPLVKAIEARQA